MARKKQAASAEPRIMVAEVTVKVDGQKYTLRADMNALADFEERTGKSAMATLEAFERGDLSVVGLRNLVWSLLQRHHPNITLAEAGDVLSHDLDAVAEVFSKAFPQPEDDPDQDGGDAPGNGSAPGS